MFITKTRNLEVISLRSEFSLHRPLQFAKEGHLCHNWHEKWIFYKINNYTTMTKYRRSYCRIIVFYNSNSYRHEQFYTERTGAACYWRRSLGNYFGNSQYARQRQKSELITLHYSYHTSLLLSHFITLITLHYSYHTSLLLSHFITRFHYEIALRLTMVRNLSRNL
jgi:hypothetical protein